MTILKYILQCIVHSAVTSIVIVIFVFGLHMLVWYVVPRITESSFSSACAPKLAINNSLAVGIMVFLLTFGTRCLKGFGGGTKGTGCVGDKPEEERKGDRRA
jgi:hypothetical protein